jgi:hypothetical protein
VNIKALLLLKMGHKKGASAKLKSPIFGTSKQERYEHS